MSNACKNEEPGERGMLQKLDMHIADALARAAAAEARCAAGANASMCADYEALAKSWRHLAESYQFVETLERFLIDSRAGMGTRPHLQAAE